MAKSIGDDLDPAVAAAVGAKYHRGHRQAQVAARKARGEVDASKAEHGRRALSRAELEANPGWSVALLNEVRQRTDEELKRDALAIIAYQQVGRYGVSKVASLMGQTPYWVKTTLRVASERNLVDDVVSRMRARVEHDILPDAVDSLHQLVKGKSEKSVLGVLQGVGVLKSDGTSDAPRAMALTVNIVNQVGVTTPSVIDPANIVGAPSVIVHQQPDPKP